MNKSLLNSMYRRRMSCPQHVQQLWDAVKVVRCQRQVPNLERIAKYMLRTYSVSEVEVARQLGYCVRDGLLLITKKKASKGSKSGVEQEGYKLPDTEAERDKHDWYCSVCHTGGDVIPCGECHRVYHLSCISNLHGAKQKYQCEVCQGIEEDKVLADLKQNQLNKLLVMVCSILKDRYGILARSSDCFSRPITIGTPGAQIDIGAESWRIPFLIHKFVDISQMASWARSGVYTNLSQFVADAQTIVHNIVIFHGVNSNLADLARQMARDCKTEVTQAGWCPTCYMAAGKARRLSSSSKRKALAAKPCRPPHQLVYASVKGHPYWPAKVLSSSEDKLGVRFFGGGAGGIPSLSCATVDRNLVLSITANMQGVKRTSSWNRACDELKRHQELLKRLEEGDYESSSSSSESDESIKSEKPVKPKTPEKLPVVLVGPPPKPRPGPGRPKGSLNKPKPPKPPASSSDSESEDRLAQKSKKGKQRTAEDEEDLADEEVVKKIVEGVEASAVKKKRGRPSLKTEQGPKKKRGRPPKKKVEEVEVKESEEEKPELDLEKPCGTVSDEEDKADEPLLNRDDLNEDSRPAEDSLSVPSPPKSPLAIKNEEEIVSSSCMEPQVRCFGTQTKHESKKDLLAKLSNEIEELKAVHSLELKSLKEAHAQEITATKKKQWCYNCEQEAIYHCCWNTAYCSTECQQLHWQREHKRVCRRKR